MKFEVIQDDITKLDGDAIVISIGNNYELGGGVARLIWEQIGKNYKEKYNDKESEDNGKLGAEKLK